MEFNKNQWNSIESKHINSAKYQQILSTKKSNMVKRQRVCKKNFKAFWRLTVAKVAKILKL